VRLGVSSSPCLRTTPVLFAKVLDFVYLNTVPYQLDDETWCWLKALRPLENFGPHGQVDDAVSGIVATYLVADKLCIEPLMNALHDLFRKIHLEVMPKGTVVQTLTEQGPHGGLMRQWAIMCVAKDIQTNGWDIYRCTDPEMLTDFIEKSTNHAVEVLEAVSRHDEGSCDDL
jgi:hypothetical protein